MSNELDLSLKEYAFEAPRKISHTIERQFPAIYREEGRELIDLVKYYYKFLEDSNNQSVYNARRMYQYRDIDKTLDSMLLFFKNKFLNGLFFDKDTRFIVKNILDLYRRKGSTEGIELFFKLFFQSEVEIYYPSVDIFKPSDSKWVVGNFLQLYPIKDPSLFSNIGGIRIFGSISNAEAFVDNVYFVNIDSSYIPIVFISNQNGQFRRFDTVYSRNPSKVFGVLYGSLREVLLDDNRLFTSNNQVGDIVEIKSETGVNARATVSEITDELSGEIQFKVIDGGYGYTIDNTDMLVSSQVLFFENTNRVFKLNERVGQINSANNLIQGIVVGQSNEGIGVRLNDVNAPIEVGIVNTLDREENISVSVFFATEANDTASATVESIKDTEEITIITDLISNFLDVPLSSNNYSEIPPALAEMTGTIFNEVIPNLETPLNEAFVPGTYVIGSINTLNNINPGSEYVNDVFILARENTFYRFNLVNQILRIITTVGVNILEGDIITQERTIKSFGGDEISTTVKGRVVKVEGNNITILKLSYESFVISRNRITNNLDTPAFKDNLSIPLDIINITFDTNSSPLGLNADIEGKVSFSIGKIQKINVFDSGIGYENQKPVEIFNISKSARANNELEIDATGLGITPSFGITEGNWVTTNSNINTSKVIQDSFFYQDYSYEITTDIAPDIYEEVYKDIIHPAGLKLFTRFGKNDFMDIEININLIIETLSELPDESNTVFVDSGYLYSNL